MNESDNPKPNPPIGGPHSGVHEGRGFLVDHEIQAYLDQGVLIEKGTSENGCIRHASYTLRLGDEVRIADTAHAEKRVFSIHPLKKGEAISLEPGQTAMLYSIERLRFPKNILGFTVARGLLFTEALSPENTYVDPGFTGSIYTTVTNISNRIVSLQHGMQIARLFFYELRSSVKNGYSSGSALGIAQQLDSVRSVAISSPEHCHSAPLRQIVAAIRQTPTSGMHLAEFCSRNSIRQLQLGVFAFIWPLLLLIANSSSSVKAALNGPVLSNFIASVLAFLVTIGLPRLLNSLRQL